MKKHIGDIIGLVLLAFVAACRFITPVADFYAERCYPIISAVLSWPASLVPFSLEELTVVGFFIAFIAVIVRAIRRRKKFLWWLGRTGRVVLWLLVWFYLGWGNNYFRTPLYARLGVKPAQFEQETFDRFLNEYTDMLYDCVSQPQTLETQVLEQRIKNFYAQDIAACGYTPLRSWQHVKKPLINPLYSAVSILGWLGPFFCETQVNLDVPGLQYPSTLAHEMSHLCGVTNEGEANYWAYAFCRQSEDPSLRYSGCLAIFPYVVQNVRALLPPNQSAAWEYDIPQQVWDDSTALNQFWLEKRVPFIEKAQRRIMDLFLKSNGISDGARSYQGVVGIIITMDERGNHPAQ